MKIDNIKTCVFYQYENASYLIVRENDKKYIKNVNQQLILTYKDIDYKIYITEQSLKENDYYLYDFYCLDITNFEYGMNNGYINYGRQNIFITFISYLYG